MQRPLNTTTVLCACLLLAAVAWGGCSGGKEKRQMDTQATSKGAANPMSAAQKKNLRSFEEVLEVGMSRQEIIQHFGKGWERGTRLIYDLGPRSLGPDTDTLIIEFNGNDKLVKYRVSRG
jgi:hypothetical protein